jgi:hypothetical protein
MLQTEFSDFNEIFLIMSNAVLRLNSYKMNLNMFTA